MDTPTFKQINLFVLWHAICLQWMDGCNCKGLCKESFDICLKCYKENVISPHVHMLYLVICFKVLSY